MSRPWLLIGCVAAFIAAAAVKRAAALLLALALVLLAWPAPSTGRPPSTPEPITVWTAYPSPVARMADPTTTVSAFATHRPAPSASATIGVSVSGIASWYDYVPGGAAAGPALRRALGPGWRGTIVTVCATRCVTVKLSDWCGCNTSTEKLIDLDARSFAKLAPLSRGVVRVTVSW